MALIPLMVAAVAIPMAGSLSYLYMRSSKDGQKVVSSVDPKPPDDDDTSSISKTLEDNTVSRVEHNLVKQYISAADAKKILKPTVVIIKIEPNDNLEKLNRAIGNFDRKTLRPTIVVKRPPQKDLIYRELDEKLEARRHVIAGDVFSTDTNDF